MKTASSPARARLLHPIALAALALLLLNDHILKARCPGVLTGKLSDVAGLVFFPLFLAALVETVARRPRGPIARPDRLLAACCLATALAFTAVKLWPPATALFAALLAALQWPFRAAFALLQGLPAGAPRPVDVVRDPSDLLALPSVAIAYFTPAITTSCIERG